MIGDKHLHAETVGCFHAFNAGDAIVHFDKYVWPDCSGGGKPHDFWRQAITVFETIGNKVVYYCAKFSQRSYSNGTSGGAVRIIIGYDQETLSCKNCVCQECRYFGNIPQALKGNQSRQFHFELSWLFNPACSINPSQHRMEAISG